MNSEHYLINRHATGMDTASRSLFLVSQHVKLSPEETQAIRYHDGRYVPENKFVAHREKPLTRLLQYADNWSKRCRHVIPLLNYSTEYSTETDEYFYPVRSTGKNIHRSRYGNL